MISFEPLLPFLICLDMFLNVVDFACSLIENLILIVQFLLQSFSLRSILLVYFVDLLFILFEFLFRNFLFGLDIFEFFFLQREFSLNLGTVFNDRLLLLLKRCDFIVCHINPLSYIPHFRSYPCVLYLLFGKLLIKY